MSNITYRLTKGTELTFEEVDDNFRSLDSDIRANRHHFDSELEQFGLARDSDFLAILAQRDSDAAAIILYGIARHDSDISDLNSRLDSEHAWNVVEHHSLDSNLSAAIDSLRSSLVSQIQGNDSAIDSEHAWNVAEHAKLDSAIEVVDGNITTNVNLLQSSIDSEHTWNKTEHSRLQNNIDSVNDRVTDLKGSVDNLEAGNITLANSFTVQGTSFDGSSPESVSFTAGAGIDVTGTVITNTDPDQEVALTGSGGITVSGSYPNFTVDGSNVTGDGGETYTAGTGLTLVGTEFRNTAPDQTVTVSGSGGITVNGSYPSFTIDGSGISGETYTAGTGIAINNSNVIRNTAPDQTVTITGGGQTTVTGTYPNFVVSTVVATDSGGLGLSDLSAVNSGTTSSGGELSYSNTTGVFTFKPVDVTQFGKTYSSSNGITVDNGADTISMTGSYTGIFSATVALSSDIHLGAHFYRDAECGIAFTGTGTAGNVMPADGTGSSIDNAIDLGRNDKRFKNGYFGGQITAGGDVVAFSDERLKDDIKTLDGSKVFEMRGVSYTKDGKDGSGVIAQELQKVAPELVHDDGEYLGVAYGNLVGYLIEAVKELKAEIEILKDK